jgi:hypothetical protein
VPVTLQPGECKFVFATGHAENAETEKWANDGAPNLAAARRLARCRKAIVERAFAEHRRCWDSPGTLQVSTPARS